MLKASFAAALALTPFAASAGGLAPEVMEAPVVVVADDDVTGFAPAFGGLPLVAGVAAIGLIAAVAGNNGGNVASATSGTN